MEMRRTILITVNSLFLLCAALMMGATVGVGALAAPAAFRALEGMQRDGVPLAGYAVGAALQRLNALSLTLVILMLALAVFEAFYRLRPATRRILWWRVIVALGTLLITVYLSQVLMPAMRADMAVDTLARFRENHGIYRMWTTAQVVLTAAMIVMTTSVNIGPRRDGGHPRNAG